MRKGQNARHMTLMAWQEGDEILVGREVPDGVCGRAGGGGPKRGTQRDGAVPCVRSADGLDGVDENRFVASRLLC